MKKLFQFFAASMLFALPLHAQFTTVGSVTVAPSPSGSGNTYTMTQATPCSGALISSAIWSNTTVNFNQSFNLLFDGRFTVPPNVTGADGFCAVFGSNLTSTSVNGGGGYMGYYNGGTTNPDFNNSIAIEVDIFNNFGGVSDPSPYVDHIMGTMNGSHTTLISASTAAIQADPSSMFIKDGVSRSYEIRWDCEAKVLRVYCNGSLRISTPFDPSTVFTNVSAVPWGFTSATGSYCSTTEIDNPHIVNTGVVCSSDTEPCDISIEAIITPEDCDVTVDVPAGQIPAPYILIGYEVIWGDGSSNIYTTPPPYTHHYTSTGGYQIEVKAIVYNPEGDYCCKSYAFSQWTDVVCPEGEGKKSSLNTGDENQLSNMTKGIEVYPNPTQGNLNVSSKSKINSLHIYDLSGREVYAADFENTSNITVDTKALTNGIYIIKMLDENGNINKATFELKK